MAEVKCIVSGRIGGTFYNRGEKYDADDPHVVAVPDKFVEVQTRAKPKSTTAKPKSTTAKPKSTTGKK